MFCILLHLLINVSLVHASCYVLCSQINERAKRIEDEIKEMDVRLELIANRYISPFPPSSPPFPLLPPNFFFVNENFNRTRMKYLVERIDKKSSLYIRLNMVIQFCVGVFVFSGCISIIFVLISAMRMSPARHLL